MVSKVPGFNVFREPLDSDHRDNQLSNQILFTAVKQTVRFFEHLQTLAGSLLNVRRALFGNSRSLTSMPVKAGPRERSKISQE